MNVLVKKEIRLLLPAWAVAVLLAMVQGITRPYDFYVAALLLFGLSLMALTTMGREASLNTFSSLLAQPAERSRLWTIKLWVLSGGFLSVFAVWLAAFCIAFLRSKVEASDRENSYDLFITICLIATATFTGGLWTTLLLRQLAGAFWLTLLVPATLSGFSAAFTANGESASLVIGVLSVVIGVYSVTGFLLARWLFFRAQDVGWSGGVIALPDWKLFRARARNVASMRVRRPVLALIKKEIQMHQASLMGAVGLLVLHAGVIVLRTVHHFPKDSAGAILTAIFWILWVVMAPVIGCTAVAEERRHGVMEGQLCQPVSRRIQFLIKALMTLFLGIFLGGVMPMVVEGTGVALGAPAMFEPAAHSAENNFAWFELGVVGFAAWLTFVGFFASTLAKSFLSAVGFGVVVFFGCVLLVPLFLHGAMLFVDSTDEVHLLPLIIGVPTMIGTLGWLAYLNFNHFRDDWGLWRRNLIGVAAALLFIFASSNLLYHRAWEIFEPAEPSHGPARFSFANRPALSSGGWGAVQVQLPDGRIWWNQQVGDDGWYGGQLSWVRLWHALVRPIPVSVGAGFFAGTNWSSMAVLSDNTAAGIQADGTLWISVRQRGADKMVRVGNENDWKQITTSPAGLLLLKQNGQLWRYGDPRIHSDPLLRSNPIPVGSGQQWKELYHNFPGYARRDDGSVWMVTTSRDHEGLWRDERLDGANFPTLGGNACIRPDGTLWVLGPMPVGAPGKVTVGFRQFGPETNWAAAAFGYTSLVGLKNDGTLWRWNFGTNGPSSSVPPMRLGIHNDWVGMTRLRNSSVATLAADGSLWLWPDPSFYDSFFFKLPKQPRFLGSVFQPAVETR